MRRDAERREARRARLRFEEGESAARVREPVGASVGFGWLALLRCEPEPEPGRLSVPESESASASEAKYEDGTDSSDEEDVRRARR